MGNNPSFNYSNFTGVLGITPTGVDINLNQNLSNTLSGDFRNHYDRIVSELTAKGFLTEFSTLDFNSDAFKLLESINSCTSSLASGNNQFNKLGNQIVQTFKWEYIPVVNKNKIFDSQAQAISVVNTYIDFWIFKRNKDNLYSVYFYDKNFHAPNQPEAWECFTNSCMSTVSAFCFFQKRANAFEVQDYEKWRYFCITGRFDFLLNANGGLFNQNPLIQEGRICINLAVGTFIDNEGGWGRLEGPNPGTIVTCWTRGYNRISYEDYGHHPWVFCTTSGQKAIGICPGVNSFGAPNIGSNNFKMRNISFTPADLSGARLPFWDYVRNEMVKYKDIPPDMFFEKSADDSLDLYYRDSLRDTCTGRKGKGNALCTLCSSFSVYNTKLFFSNSSNYLSPYVLDNEINKIQLPPPRIDPITNKPIRRFVKVTKLSHETMSSLIAKNITLQKVTEIIPQPFSYPFSAIVGTKIDSRSFSQVPVRSFDCKLKKVLVPSNYFPLDNEGNDVRYLNKIFNIDDVYSTSKIKIYLDQWDGTFKLAWTNNPAWVIMDILLNKRYGLGNYIEPDQIDIWELYKIARWCDAVDEDGYFIGVDDSYGGKEPRQTFNAILDEKFNVFDMLNQIASTFRGNIYYMNSFITFDADYPRMPVGEFNNTDVKDGLFNYTNHKKDDEYTAVDVAYIDEKDNFKPKIEFVEDAEGIRKRGILKKEINAFGTTSRSQARRIGKHFLYQTAKENLNVNFITDSRALLYRPGDLININDELMNSYRNYGVIKNVEDINSDTFKIVIDKILDPNYYFTGEISLQTPVAKPKIDNYCCFFQPVAQKIIFNNFDVFSCQNISAINVFPSGYTESNRLTGYQRIVLPIVSNNLELLPQNENGTIFTGNLYWTTNFTNLASSSTSSSLQKVMATSVNLIDGTWQTVTSDQGKPILFCKDYTTGIAAFGGGAIYCWPSDISLSAVKENAWPQFGECVNNNFKFFPKYENCYTNTLIGSKCRNTTASIKQSIDGTNFFVSDPSISTFSLPYAENTLEKFIQSSSQLGYIKDTFYNQVVMTYIDGYDISGNTREFGHWKMCICAGVAVENNIFIPGNTPQASGRKLAQYVCGLSILFDSSKYNLSCGNGIYFFEYIDTIRYESCYLNQSTGLVVQLSKIGKLNHIFTTGQRFFTSLGVLNNFVDQELGKGSISYAELLETDRPSIETFYITGFSTGINMINEQILNEYSELYLTKSGASTLSTVNEFEPDFLEKKSAFNKIKLSVSGGISNIPIGSSYGLRVRNSQKGLFKIMSITENYINEYNIMATQYGINKYQEIEEDKDIETIENTYNQLYAYNTAKIAITRETAESIKSPIIHSLNRIVNASNGKSYLVFKWNPVQFAKKYKLLIRTPSKQTSNFVAEVEIDGPLYDKNSNLFTFNYELTSEEVGTYTFSIEAFSSPIYDENPAFNIVYKYSAPSYRSITVIDY